MYVGFDMKDLINRCRESFEKRSSSPDERRKFLVDAGILNEDGDYVEFFKNSNVDDFELTTYTEDECKNKTKNKTSAKNTSSKKLKRCPKTIDFVEELCGDKYCKTKKGEGY